MSIADKIFIDTCRQIIDEGVWDTDLPVRPRWLDGTPAHTVKKFCIVNRYDLSKEFPILTIRRTFWKSAIDELLWIWQAKSNNVHELRTRVWDAWADENGSIGKAYGYQLGVKHHYPEGDMDQVDKVIWDLRHNPASRRIMTNIYTFADLSEMALYPCAYSMTFNVSGKRLNAILNQRSQDMLAANNWNVIEEFAEYMGGREEVWYATNIQIYDYVKAYKQLNFNAAMNYVENPTAYELWFETNGKLYSVKPGESLKLA